jgi:hypothetical protein
MSPGPAHVQRPALLLLTLQQLLLLLDLLRRLPL